MISRIFLIIFACLIASLAAGMVVAIAVLMPAWSDLALGSLDDGTFGVVVAFGAMFLSAFALLPLLLVVVLAESFAIRSVLFYAVAGAGLAAVLYLHFRSWDTLAFSVNGFARRELEIIAAAGIVAGLVYWALAGRKAGAWRRSTA